MLISSYPSVLSVCGWGFICTLTGEIMSFIKVMNLCVQFHSFYLVFGGNKAYKIFIFTIFDNVDNFFYVFNLQVEWHN